MADKRMTEDEVVDRLESGMTIGIGGWASRRKPMSLVRAIARSKLEDLTLVTYGGPDVGLLVAAGKVRRVVYGFVSMDNIPLEPHFRTARQEGRIEVTEYDEDMLQRGLYAAAMRLPFMPTRSGLGSDVMRVNPELRTVTSPYGDDEVVAMPPLHLDEADSRDLQTGLRDGVVALAVGLGITILLLVVLQTDLDLTLTDLFRATSTPIAHGRNVVNVILVDYRAIDTLGEISVVMAAGLAILALIRLRASTSGTSGARSGRGRKIGSSQ